LLGRVARGSHPGHPTLELVSGWFLRVRVDQALCGGLCAVGSYRRGDAMGAGATSGWRAWLRAVAKRVGGRHARRVRDPDPEVADALCPVVLVVALGDDDLGCPGSCNRGGGARAAVVHDGSDPPEQRLMVGLCDQDAVGPVVWQWQVGPPAGHDRAAAQRTGRSDHYLADVFCGAHMLPRPK
jgi:hypothetical protein